MLTDTFREGETVEVCDPDSRQWKPAVVRMFDARYVYAKDDLYPYLRDEEVRKLCTWCAESGNLYAGMHIECGIRTVIGSAKCQQKLCKRLGGPGCGDDPNLTKRQAAREAMIYWRQNYLSERASLFSEP